MSLTDPLFIYGRAVAVHKVITVFIVLVIG